jgi:hypothetical protein
LTILTTLDFGTGFHMRFSLSVAGDAVKRIFMPPVNIEKRECQK